MKLRDDVLSHLWRQYPQHCLILTDPGARRAIDVGVDRAAVHGFRELAQVRAFVTLMVFLGSHFDEDPQLPWVAEHLQQTAKARRADAMHGLLGKTAERMRRIVGQRGGYYRRALAWAQAQDFDAIVAKRKDDDDLHGLLNQLHRRKYAALGEWKVQQLIHAARAAGGQHGLTTQAGVAVYVTLMFLLGSAFDRDPFHPWAADTLANPTSVDPDERARRLHAAALGMLARYTRLDRLMQSPRS